MKTRAELKTEVKQLFRGRWRHAVGLCIVVSLLSMFSVMATQSDMRDQMQSGDYGSTTSAIASNVSLQELTLVAAIVVLALVFELIIWLVVKTFKVGTSYAMLDWVRQPQREIHPVADSTVGFTKHYVWGIFGLAIYQAVLVFLWMLLLIVPGIIKLYAYSQSFYVYKDMLAATPQGQARPRFRDAVTTSRRLMAGHKWQFFWLQVSFIGWAILSMFTLGIGQLWLIPYIYGTNAKYYDELTRQAQAAAPIS
ncbi:DUF975 family protein [Lactiplantibacillus plajomi]|uniref:DUF975 family protein n=1 Tax=Lactiplantibacillus plajomi TaxID=1457217 RepID=A0ABV6K3V3_9LACO|nr:DUF975 family protein [Lactiplantibacillus plajomi]